MIEIEKKAQDPKVELVKEPCILKQAIVGDGIPGDLKTSSNPAEKLKMPPVSAMVTSSSQRETQTKLLSSGIAVRASGEKDEYLLRLLSIGAKPPLPSSAPGPPTVFRIPDPVPQKASAPEILADAAAPAPVVAADGAPPEKGSAPDQLLTAGTASGQPTSEVAPGWSYSETQTKLGSEAAASLRSTFVAHQVAFLEQLYDLHRAIAVQKVLVYNCPEIKPLLNEAAKILISASSGQKDTILPTNYKTGAPRGKRARLNYNTKDPEKAGNNSNDDEEPALRPDSQFAAGPLPGETAATGDGSGDDGHDSGPNGSGGNGSGGGSNSPQPQLPVVVPHRGRMRALQAAAPSGASQTPIMFARAQMAMTPWQYPQNSMYGVPPGMYAAPPPGAFVPGGASGYLAGPMAPPPPQMMAIQPPPPPPSAPAQGGNNNGSGGAAQKQPAATTAPSPQQMVPPPVAQADPMAWWYQNYYGRHQQGAQQMQAAAAAAFGGGPQMRWWQDSQATFGPAADPRVVAAAAAGGFKTQNAAGEAESAPPSAAGAVPAPSAQKKSRGASVVAPPISRRPKRKPSDPIEEASSGTTGQDHHLGPHVVTDDAHFKSRSPVPHHRSRAMPPGGGKAAKKTANVGVVDATAAKLLLSISGKDIIQDAPARLSGPLAPKK